MKKTFVTLLVIAIFVMAAASLCHAAPTDGADIEDRFVFHTNSTSLKNLLKLLRNLQLHAITDFRAAQSWLGLVDGQKTIVDGTILEAPAQGSSHNVKIDDMDYMKLKINTFAISKGWYLAEFPAK